jgi:hypothetical protein
VRVAAPIYLKYGVRNSPPLYPAGRHLEGTILALSRERVRRAAIGMGILRRYAPDAVASPRAEPAARTSGSEGATRAERGVGVPASERVGESEGRSPSD